MFSTGFMGAEHGTTPMDGTTDVLASRPREHDDDIGGTGDLTGRFLLPALAALPTAGHIDDRFGLTAASREDWDRERYRESAVASSTSKAPTSRPTPGEPSRRRRTTAGPMSLTPRTWPRRSPVTTP
ncbi:hypothetical protein AB0M87_12855 [Streptomyces sp. NPDC051320]|uniref:hypothetical protein n=1 Tax=Streptomyces sp. NPDC051320 TaxID=3154644 RepID=UPI003417CD62